jgi:hypothetical protein
MRPVATIIRIETVGQKKQARSRPSHATRCLTTGVEAVQTGILEIGLVG